MRPYPRRRTIAFGNLGSSRTRCRAEAVRRRSGIGREVRSLVPDLRSSGLALLDARIVEIEAGLMVDQEAQLVDAPMHAADIDPALDAQNSLIGERARELDAMRPAYSRRSLRRRAIITTPARRGSQ